MKEKEKEKEKEMEILQFQSDLEKVEKNLIQCQLKLELNEKQLQNSNILNSELQASELLLKSSITNFELEFVTKSKAFSNFVIELFKSNSDACNSLLRIFEFCNCFSFNSNFN